MAKRKPIKKYKKTRMEKRTQINRRRLNQAITFLKKKEYKKSLSKLKDIYED